MIIFPTVTLVCLSQADETAFSRFSNSKRSMIGPAMLEIVVPRSPSLQTAPSSELETDSTAVLREKQITQKRA
jgi:hypothetical protein